MHTRSKLILLVLLLLLVLVVGTTVLAQSSAGFDLSWHVIGSGGGASSSASYRVNGTIGQSIANQPAAGGTSFTVSSGYWFVDTGTTGTTLYLPAILKNSF